MVRKRCLALALPAHLFTCVAIITMSASALAQTCAPWRPPSHLALQNLPICEQSPISRQLGSVCTEVRWLCADEPIAAWVARLFTHSQAPWFVHPHREGLVFAQWSQFADTSLAIFWEPNNTNLIDSKATTQLMVSRFKPLVGASTSPNPMLSSDSLDSSDPLGLLP